MKTRTLILTALLVGGLASTAQATVVTKNAPYEVMNYTDLNIANAADAAILQERVEAAARRVCVRSVVMLRLDFYNPLQQCVHFATDRAMEDVKSRGTSSAVVRL